MGSFQGKFELRVAYSPALVSRGLAVTFLRGLLGIYAGFVRNSRENEIGPG